MDYRGFAAALQALDSGQADGMISGMTVTDERKQSYDFSDPYFNSGIQIRYDQKGAILQSNHIKT